MMASLARLVFPKLAFAELWWILNFLSHHDMYYLGSTCRTAFVTFMRERTLRAGYNERKQRLQEQVGGATCYSKNLIDDARFLAKLSCHEKVLLVSYPRSGNSYVRKLLELATGIVTGSDSRPNRALTSSLLRYGYKGEGVTDQSVWVVKSHYPERLGYIRVPVTRVILVVRNPFDAIESYFHMGMTNTHDKVLSSMAFESLKDMWGSFIQNEADIWKAFHNFWIERLGILPILIVRYEDLLQNEEMCMRKILEFISNGKSPTGSNRFFPKQLYGQLTLSQNIGPGYKPKNRKVGKALSRMTLLQAKDILSRVGPLYSLFGYDVTLVGNDSSSTAADAFIQVNTLPCHFGDEWRGKLSLVGDGKGQIIANDLINIRDANDPFGRKITETRQKLTNNDLDPFETD